MRERKEMVDGATAMLYGNGMREEVVARMLVGAQLKGRERKGRKMSGWIAWWVTCVVKKGLGEMRGGRMPV